MIQNDLHPGGSAAAGRGDTARGAVPPASITVVMPCRNAGPYVARALASVAAQVLRPREVVVVDDGSTDDSAAVIAAAERCLAAQGISLRVLQVAATNAAAARMAALAVSTAEFIAFLDADDLWDPRHLDRAMTQLGRDDVAFIAGFQILAGDGLSNPPCHDAGPSSPGSGLSAEHFMDLLYRGLPFGHSTVVYRRARVMEVGGFDTSQIRRHDIDLWLRVVAGHTWGWHPGPDAQYRIGVEGSLSGNVAERAWYMLRALRRNLPAYPYRSMSRLLRLVARNCARTALTRGTVDDRRRAREEAWPLLAWPQRCGMRMLDGCAPAAQRMIALLDRVRSRAWG